MPITLAELIKEARLRAGDMTQRELAIIADTSMENINSIENGRNKNPSPEIIKGLANALDISVEDIFHAIAGTLNRFPWDKVSDLDLKDPELELMFRQVDSLPEGEVRERVKAFIRFTLDEERKRKRRQTEEGKKTSV